MPFYGEVGNYQGQPRRIDTTESFWAKYDDGEAVVKLYEQNNYTVGIIGVGSEGDFGWGYEFIRPQFADTTYNSLVVNRMDAIFLNETNQSYKIVMTEWEINKMNVLTNLFKYVLFGVLWAVGTYFIFRIDPKVALAFTIFYWGLIKVIGFI